MQGKNYGLLVKTIKKKKKKKPKSPFRSAGRVLTFDKHQICSGLPFTLQHDREFVMFRFYFPLFIKLFMVLLCVIFKLKRVIFTRGVLSIPACDVYVRLETTSAAIKIA